MRSTMFFILYKNHIFWGRGGGGGGWIPWEIPSSGFGGASVPSCGLEEEKLVTSIEESPKWSCALRMQRWNWSDDNFERSLQRAITDDCPWNKWYISGNQSQICKKHVRGYSLEVNCQWHLKTKEVKWMTFQYTVEWRKQKNARFECSLNLTSNLTSEKSLLTELRLGGS